MKICKQCNLKSVEEKYLLCSACRKRNQRKKKASVVPTPVVPTSVVPIPVVPIPVVPTSDKVRLAELIRLFESGDRTNLNEMKQLADKIKNLDYRGLPILEGYAHTQFANDKKYSFYEAIGIAPAGYYLKPLPKKPAMEFPPLETLRDQEFLNSLTNEDPNFYETLLNGYYKV